ncbi:MAG: DUF423 domain-containing protein [Sporolactobacillus sp.]
MKYFIAIGAALAFLSVAFGAFGAHILKERISAHYLAIYQTGVQYQMVHSLGLILVGILATVVFRTQTQWLTSSAWLMLIGIVLFSGSLYVLSISGITWLGAITPFGGVAFLAAWALVIIAAVRS